MLSVLYYQLLHILVLYYSTYYATDVCIALRNILTLIFSFLSHSATCFVDVDNELGVLCFRIWRT